MDESLLPGSFAGASIMSAKEASRRLRTHHSVTSRLPPFVRAAQIGYSLHVLIRLPSLLLIRIAAVFLLATIGLQASEPVRGVALDRGSAFSAGTADVAISSSRRAEPVRLVVLPAPPLPRPGLVLATFAPIAGVSRPLSRPDSTGPPARIILSRQPAPRAPPLA